MKINSWYRKQYPKHTCQECHFEHATIPNIKAKQPVSPGKTELVDLIPQEALGMMRTKDVRLGIDTPLDTPAQVVELFWGVPGTRDVRYHSVMLMN